MESNYKGMESIIIREWSQINNYKGMGVKLTIIREWSQINNYKGMESN